MLMLPVQRTKNRCYYRQVHRTRYTALYSLSYAPGGRAIGHEVFRVRVAPAATLPNGVQVQEQEHFPSNEEFGRIAWSYTNRPEALKKFQQLESTLSK